MIKTTVLNQERDIDPEPNGPRSQLLTFFSMGAVHPFSSDVFLISSKRG